MYTQLFNILLVILPFASLASASVAVSHCYSAPVGWGVRIYVTVLKAIINTLAKTPGNCGADDYETCIIGCELDVSLIVVRISL